MTDLIGALIGIILICFLCLPVTLAIYMWTSAKIDIDRDGKDDVLNRWNT